MDLSLESQISQLQSLSKTLPVTISENSSLREDALLEARKLVLALERPDNVVERVCFQIWETVAVKIGIDLGIFRILSGRDSPQTLEDLTKTTKADPILLERILRCLASFGAVDESSIRCYKSTTVSKTFAEARNEAAMDTCLGFLTPGWLAFPAFLREHNYQNETSSTDTALAKAYNRPGDSLWEILVTTPHLKSMNTYMSTFNEGHREWFDFYPINERLGKDAKNGSEEVMMVDIGGGQGHQAIALRRKFPHLPGRFVVEDLRQGLPDSRPGDVEFLEHDFMTEQPIKGARCYYLRYVPHDWSQEMNVHILTQIRKAMKPGYSRLIVNEWIVPAQGASKFMTAQDLNMMASCGGMERTEALHREYITNAGLKVTGVWDPNDRLSEGVIEAEVA